MFAGKQFANIYHVCILNWRKFRRWLLTLPIIQKTVYKAYMSDKKFVLREYKKRLGKPPDLDCPKSFNEKNSWRKIYDRNPIYTSMVDKYLLKGIIAERAGEQYAIPLIGVWDTPKDIVWDSLPDQFVLKCNHESGSVVVCRNLRDFDKQLAIATLSWRQRRDYYLKHREWPYKNVKRKIIAEKYVGENLLDYKNYCFNGKVLYTFVWKNHSKEDGHKPDVYFCGAYDRQWNKTELEISQPSEDIIVEKPACYEEMISVSEKMTDEEIPFVSVDCYIINNRVYIGEMTFFPGGGYREFKDEKWDMILGDEEKLPGIDY